MKLSSAMEDYPETIFKLSKKEGSITSAVVGKFLRSVIIVEPGYITSIKTGGKG